MRAAYLLSPSFITRGRMGASKAALILMKNSHFDRTLQYYFSQIRTNAGSVFIFLYLNTNISIQEAIESFALPDEIDSIKTEILQKCRKLYFFSHEL